MFGRLRRKNEQTAKARDDLVGIGALVSVISTEAERSGWEGEPSGVVVAPGGKEMVGYPGLAPGGPGSWLVAFEEPAYRVGNPEPFDEATVLNRFLKLLPFTEAPE